MKKPSSDELADKATASADTSQIEIKTRQELVNVDDGKPDSKGTSKAETKSESSFSNENVFQSPPSSAGTNNIKSPSNYKSPSLSKKDIEKMMKTKTILPIRSLEFRHLSLPSHLLRQHRKLYLIKKVTSLMTMNRVIQIQTFFQKHN